ncbi:type I-E CRISPR-associated protein Cas7/Cse4/CasC [Rhodomicrobium lacus]|uniref:type I-E CRISPR-associated protein Cas7/Cse4/CasC n=1 Tax=Rhodomicrobium lacus TaxID=2498452 RepID=UPI0026E2DDE5|nr:type I-E CRISPR-associated protein Cas7/Cse4/CasC [Rhodomicrobium lacus]WKW51479.1 type I-E CRISPR-associated protein Cas7/Cse4/CasC [Rhodomicrobium lacus]
MTKFIQLHALTVYAPSNLNRDDTGRPKTAKFGGAERLRISSQALKRAIRTSANFRERLAGNLGERTTRVGDWLRDEFVKSGFDLAKATAVAKTLSAVVGTLDTSKPEPTVQNKELFFMAPGEKFALAEMVSQISKDPELAAELASYAGEIDDEEDSSEENEVKQKKSKKKGLPKKKLQDLQARVLVHADTAADIAMFGRMLASVPKYNREAAVQVAHAITTHKVVVEDDFYTAVDDLKTSAEDAGAGFIGELGFGSGVFYLYASIDRDLLLKNLGGDPALARKAIEAFVEGFAKARPSGKQNSFAAHALANYLRVEKGSQQPRSLAAAFFKPVWGDDLLAKSVEALEGDDRKGGLIAQMNGVYGALFDDARTLRAIPGRPWDPSHDSTLEQIVAFAAGE